MPPQDNSAIKEALMRRLSNQSMGQGAAAAQLPRPQPQTAQPQTSSPASPGGSPEMVRSPINQMKSSMKGQDRIIIDALIQRLRKLPIPASQL